MVVLVVIHHLVVAFDMVVKLILAEIMLAMGVVTEEVHLVLGVDELVGTHEMVDLDLEVVQTLVLMEQEEQEEQEDTGAQVVG